MTSLCGLHTINSGPPPGFPRAAVVKYVSNAPPTIPVADVVLARKVHPGDPVDQWANLSPEAAADRWLAEQNDYIQSLPPGTYYEIFNEPNIQTEQRAIWMWDTSLVCMKKIDAMGRGLKCCIGNFAKGNPARPIPSDNGTPGQAIWADGLPCLEYAAAHGHLLGFHVYGEPQDVTDISRWQHDLIMFRFREVYRWLPPEARPKFVINEWAMDTPLGQYLDPRWRATQADPEAAYMAMIAAYDTELQHDPLCVGFTVFTWGTGGDAAWRDFDLNDRMLGLMAAHITAHAGGGTVSTFLINSTVYIVSSLGAKIRGADGAQQAPPNDTASSGARATVLGGPVSLPGRAEVYYRLDFGGGKIGYVAEKSLDGTVILSANPPTTTPPSYHGEAWVRPHGTPAPVYAEHARTSAQVGTRLESSYHSQVTEAAYDGGGWWYHFTADPIGPAGWSPILPAGKTKFEDRYFDTSTGLPDPNTPAPVVIIIPPDGNGGDEEPPVITHPPVATNNLLVNGSFEQGGAGPWPNFPGSGTRAPGWVLENWSKPGDPKLPKQDADWHVPEILPVQYQVQFPEDYLRYDDGRWVLKVFADSAPTMAQFGQTVTLEAGTYELAVPFFPDQKDKNGQRPNVSADWYEGTEVALWLNNWPVAWLDGREVPIGSYTVRKVTLFAHPGGPVHVHFAMRGKWGLKQNGWFVDGCVLQKVGDTTPPPPPDGIDVAELQAALDEFQSAMNVFVARFGRGIGNG